MIRQFELVSARVGVGVSECGTSRIVLLELTDDDGKAKAVGMAVDSAVSLWADLSDAIRAATTGDTSQFVEAKEVTHEVINAVE